jgi:hypothetical protein
MANTNNTSINIGNAENVKLRTGHINVGRRSNSSNDTSITGLELKDVESESGNIDEYSDIKIEIQQLLNELAKTYPTTTENEKQIFVTQFDSQVVQQKPRVQKILIEGGIELLKLICPPLGIPIEMGRTWLETAEKSVQD